MHCDKCDTLIFRKKTKAFCCDIWKYQQNIMPPLSPEFNALCSGN